MDDSSNAPATKQDIERVLQHVGAVEQHVKAVEQHVEAAEARLADRLERAVTTMLTGFHEFARRANLRDTALESRVALIEDRLLEIEHLLGKNPPPS
jgi:hypothetical protein